MSDIILTPAGAATLGKIASLTPFIITESFYYSFVRSPHLRFSAELHGLGFVVLVKQDNLRNRMKEPNLANSRLNMYMRDCIFIRPLSDNWKIQMEELRIEYIPHSEALVMDFFYFINYICKLMTNSDLTEEFNIKYKRNAWIMLMAFQEIQIALEYYFPHDEISDFIKNKKAP